MRVLSIYLFPSFSLCLCISLSHMSGRKPSNVVAVWPCGALFQHASLTLLGQIWKVGSITKCICVLYGNIITEIVSMYVYSMYTRLLFLMVMAQAYVLLSCDVTFQHYAIELPLGSSVPRATTR